MTMRRPIATAPKASAPPAPVYGSPCPDCLGTGLVRGSRMGFNEERQFVEIETKCRQTCQTCGGWKFLDHPKAPNTTFRGGIAYMTEATAEKPAKAPRTPKEPKPKAEKAPKASKFPGTYSFADAVAKVETFVAENPDKPLGSSRTWTAIVAGHNVAPKWLVEQMTGVKASEFTTGDAVSFLAGIQITATKEPAAA